VASSTSEAAGFCAEILAGICFPGLLAVEPAIGRSGSSKISLDWAPGGKIGFVSTLANLSRADRSSRETRADV